MKRSMELLPQISFCILLALSLKPRHGYEIMQQVELDTMSRVRIGPGSLYTTIKKLIEDQLIEGVEMDGNERRRYYRLTKKGWQRLNTEVDYYATTAQLSKIRLAKGWEGA
jgi:DNA-binding PadR family transcriptional regulator